MKKTLLVITALLIMGLMITPVITGRQIRNDYYHFVEIINNQIPPNSGVQLQIDSYQTGWLSSSAVISLKSAETSGVYIKSSIHHGPVIATADRFILAYAYI